MNFIDIIYKVKYTIEQKIKNKNKIKENFDYCIRLSL